jgi:hypothetical protein
MSPYNNTEWKESTTWTQAKRSACIRTYIHSLIQHPRKWDWIWNSSRTE